MDAIIRQFNGAGVRYLLIGGQAVRLHGLPRFSMDWDFFVPPKDLTNFAKLNEILESEIDFPVMPLGEKGEGFVQTYQTMHGILQFHLIIPGIPKFEEAEKECIVKHTEAGTPVRCLSAEQLLKAKESTGRPQDAQDICFLKELLKNGVS